VVYNLTASEENAAAADSWKRPRTAALAVAMKATAIQARIKLRIFNLSDPRI
jgi:hypothetical protein